MIPKLTKIELGKKRTARELRDWVQCIHAKFGQTAEGVRAARLLTGPLVKKFYEEVWPLANYAYFFFLDRGDIRFKPVIGNQHYDALLINDSGSTLCYFEVTRSLHNGQGYQEHLQCEHLNKYGYVRVAGPPLERNKTGDIVPSRDEGTNHTDYFEKTICQIDAAIRAKANKKYHANTVLIVQFQGFFLQKDDDQTKLDEVAKSKLCDLASGFSELALVEDAARFGFRYPTPGKPAASQGGVAGGKGC